MKILELLSWHWCNEYWKTVVTFLGLFAVSVGVQSFLFWSDNLLDASVFRINPLSYGMIADIFLFALLIVWALASYVRHEADVFVYKGTAKNGRIGIISLFLMAIAAYISVIGIYMFPTSFILIVFLCVVGVVILAIILFVMFWISVLLIVPYKQWSFDPAYIFESVWRNFRELFAFVFGTRAAPGIMGKFYQCIAAMIAGSALATCGAVFQGSFRNVLAGPSTMGVMSGGTLGILVYLLLFCEAHPEVVNVSASEELEDNTSS